MPDTPSQGLRIVSTLFEDGRLEVNLADLPVPAPGPDEVIVKVKASPINPSDIMVMMAFADPAKAQFGEKNGQPSVTAQLSANAARAKSNRFGKSLRIGLEGAGTVVAAGANVQNMVGQNVSLLAMGEGMFAQYAKAPATDCVPLPDGISAAEGASMFVNPLTALAIVEQTRLDGCKGLIHTAAASNLGQMLVKICLEDDMPLVNIVRRQEQADLLRGLGAKHVCNSGAPTFREDLHKALAETGAMVAFDAIGGGAMAGQLLAAMEAAAVARMPESGPYGSFEHKQVYVYGDLDASHTELSHMEYGMSWGLTGWAMPQVLAKVGPERAMEMRQRVVDGLRTTFASTYTRTISLGDVLNRDVMIAYNRQATGEKFLIDPTL